MVQRLDPRTRLLLIIFFSTLIFFVDKILIAVILMLFIITLRLLLNVPIGKPKSFFTLSMLVLFIIIMQILFFPGGKYIYKPIIPVWIPVLGGKGSLKLEGLIYGLMISCRLMALFFLLPVLTKTSSVYEISTALVSFGLNYRAAFIITSAFNFIPVFNEESRTIIEALKLRGMDTFGRGSVFSGLKTYSSLAIPLVLAAMRKASAAGIAADSRAFGVYKTRTWVNKPVMRIYDYIVICSSLIFIAFILFLNFFIIRG
ncbi:MAG: energy-coupling factor transporter transmembrane protein EcfT [Treponema sp.]|jgi:energy-coupling factor transport system permease protein|nr:energy-coupling factor transporter transmembrane protein EcfT [Treponema sp.]